MKLKTIINLLLVFISFFILQACSIERKLAKNFLNNKNKGTVLLMYPNYLYKSNLRDANNKKENLDNYVLDSLAIQKSLFLKFITNDIFLNKYYIALKEELEKAGFKIYEESETDVFLLSENSAWILNPAQFQLEEETEPYIDYHYYDTTLFSKKFLLNKVSLHTWLEFSPLNPDSNSMEVLYSEQSVTDKVKGKFKRHLIWGTIDYDYSIILVNISHAYDLSEYAANKHASFLFDFIMNKYISNNMPNNWKQNKYFNYNFEKKRLKNFKEGFILIK